MKMANPGPGAQTHEPERMASLVGGLCLALSLAIIVAWWKWHREIVIAVLFVQNIELNVIALFTHRYDMLLNDLHHANPANVTPKALWTLCTITGSVMRWPALLLIVVLAILCLTRAPLERHRGRFGLDGMQAVLARIHPLGAAWPARTLPLVEPARPGETLRPMDPALKPEEWVARYVLGETLEQKWESATAALTKQLGGRWRGLDGLTTAELAVFFALALYMQRRKDEAQAVLEDLARSLSRGVHRRAPDKAIAEPAGFRRKLRKKIDQADLADALGMAEKHAWNRTALLSLLQQARLRSGVVNPGLFAAIQLLDRDLWLILSAVSYPRDSLPPYVMATATCPEASAAIAHWAAECAAVEPLADPRIYDVLSGLGIQ